MPINKNGIGFSDNTELKQKHFSQIIFQQIQCCQAIIKKWKSSGWCEEIYYYFDINSGSGFSNNKKGSSLLFLDTTIRKFPKLSFKYLFIDENSTNCSELQRYILKKYKLKAQDIKIINGDHNKKLPRFYLKNTPKKTFGLIYNDSNGIPSFDLLKDFSNRSSHSKIDILINCPCAAIKKRNGITNPNIYIKDRRDLIDYLEQINKKYWLIREPYGKFQWSFFIGTNWTNFPVFEKIGFYNWDSKKGMNILTKLNFSTKEIKQLKRE